MKVKYIFIILLSLIGFVGCSKDQNSTPKPKTYFRIDVPKPEYLTFDTLSLPFTFKYPNYGVIEEREDKKSSV